MKAKNIQETEDLINSLQKNHTRKIEQFYDQTTTAKVKRTMIKPKLTRERASHNHQGSSKLFRRREYERQQEFFK